MNKIITISREFGSGGRELGRRLSEQLNIAYYDQEIVSEVAKRTKFDEQYLEQIIEQKQIISFPIHIGRSFYPLENPMLEQSQTIISEQHRIIREVAKNRIAALSARCPDYILQDCNPFRIFVYADMNSKIKRCREKAYDKEAMTDTLVRKLKVS